MKKFLLLFLCFTLAFSMIGCGGTEAQAPAEENAESTDATEQVDEDLKLTIYAGVQEDMAMLVVKEFEKATGVKTEMVRMSGGEIFARIKAEKEKSISIGLVWRWCTYIYGC